MTEQGTMKTFMKGAVLLTIAAFIVKLLSAVYRVPFQNLVGDRGFYIYQQVYPFIGIFTVWASSGFAVAVSKMLADAEERERSSLMRIAFGYIAAVSAAVFALLFFGAPLLSGWMGDPELAPLLKTGALTVLFLPLLSVLKGRFQSGHQMTPVAYAQVLEQAVRVAVILLGTSIAVSQGFSLYAAGEAAIWGSVAGAAAGAVLLALWFRRTAGQEASGVSFPVWPAVKKMTAISLGASISALLLLLFQLVDSFTVFRLLAENGTSRLAAMEQKGIYDRGQPLVQFGILLASSFALGIVPLVAQMLRKQEGRPAELYVRLSFRLAFLFAAAAAAGLALVMPYVNEMLFKSREGTGALILFSLQIVWMSLLLVVTAILHGLGKVRVPVLLITAGLFVKGAGNLILIPGLGIAGAAAAGNLGLGFAVLGLFFYFKKIWPLQFAPLRYYGWLAAAGMAMALTVFCWCLLADGYLFDGLSGRAGATLTALTAVPLGAGVFMALIAKSRIISEKEWYFIPFGRRMASFQLWLRTERKRRERI